MSIKIPSQSEIVRLLGILLVDSVFFALGLTDSVSEPSDHGFDPAAEDW